MRSNIQVTPWGISRKSRVAKRTGQETMKIAQIAPLFESVPQNFMVARKESFLT
jgi:hypothetical protein